MLKSLFHKAVIAILSTVVFSMILSYILHTPEAEQTDDTLSYSFTTLFVIYSIYVAFIYLTVGILASWLIELKTKSQLNRILLYAICGAIVGGGIYLFVTPQRTVSMQNFFSFTLFGIFAALIFWMFHKISNLIMDKMPKKHKKWPIVKNGSPKKGL